MLNMENNYVTRETKNGPLEYNLSALTSPSETELLCPINYMYDYLPYHARRLKSQPVSLSRFFLDSTVNGIRLHTQAAKLPLHTALEHFRQTRHWKANVEATEGLLELFAKDRRSSEVMLSNGASMSSLAEKQLKIGVSETFCRSTIYMFPGADENRIRLLGQCLVLIFIYDDVWESASPETIDKLREDFISRLRGTIMSSATDTPLEKQMSAIRQGLLAGDEENGNGGAEIIETLIDFFNHPNPPREGFSSVRDYLDYRLQDTGSPFLWALTKFSIRSSVNQEDPKFHRVLALVADSISFHNDIGSYDKERRSFETGQATSMINVVDVIMKLERLQAKEAKVLAFAWQLFIENELLRELEDLKARDELSVEDWGFIDGCLLMTSGNLITSLFVARYGGEAARIA